MVAHYVHYSTSCIFCLTLYLIVLFVSVKWVFCLIAVFYFTIIYLVFLDMIKVVSKLITNNAKQKCFMHAILHICENSFKKFLEVDCQGYLSRALKVSIHTKQHIRVPIYPHACRDWGKKKNPKTKHLY